MTYPAPVKHLLGAGIGAVAPQCDYERCVFVIGHMRCGSTALSNVLCSRPEISGYGETQVPYTSKVSPGALLLNQIKRKTWKPQAKHLFDKLLHNRLDNTPPPQFFRARAIFITREPKAAIPSVVSLFRKIGSSQFVTIEKAGDYYVKRLKHMKALWRQFPENHRCAVTYEDLTQHTDEVLENISNFLNLSPPLHNHYEENNMSGVKGAGDPVNAQKHSQIVSGGLSRKYKKDLLPEEKAVIDRAENVLREARSCFHSG